MSERRRIIEPVAPAIGLIIGAVFLMVCSLASDQWLESSEPHFEVGDDYVRSIGLLGNVKLDNLGMVSAARPPFWRDRPRRRIVPRDERHEEHMATARRELARQWTDG